MKYLDNINSPEDIKKIPEEELQILADETRAVLIEKLSNTGGHVGSNLGVVELTVALHYVFSSPVDKIVWDISHQCYPHKILTGRKKAYISPEHYKDVTGFTNTKESVHDHFTMGHSSTSVSLALGLAKARDLSGGKENIIAFTGDGALSGGEIYEGLNFAGEYGKNLIVILNDNEQSVAENHGGLYKNLRQLRESGGESSHNFFISLGFEYRYLDTLEYGSARYDYHDFSVVIDEDSMSQDENKTAVKYLILRPNGHLYSKWDSKASLIF